MILEYKLLLHCSVLLSIVVSVLGSTFISVKIYELRSILSVAVASVPIMCMPGSVCPCR